MKFTASGRTGGPVVSSSSTNFLDWTVVTNSASNASAIAVTVTAGNAANCVFTCSGSSYSAVLSFAVGIPVRNIRVVGVAGSSGNRDGVAISGTTVKGVLDGLTVVGVGGRSIAYTGTSTGVNMVLSHCTLVGASGDHIVFPNTASQTNMTTISHCMITGGGGYGINPGGTNTNLVLLQNRLRDNTSGNFGTTGDYPTTATNYTTDSDDATEYVDSGSGDYRIKYGAAIWGQGYGAGDEPAPSGSAFPAQGLQSIESGVCA